VCALLGSPTEENFPGLKDLPVARGFSFRPTAPGGLRKLFPRMALSGTSYLSDAGFDLLSRLVCWDPKRRITAHAALRHPWFSEAPRAQPTSFTNSSSSSSKQQTKKSSSSSSSSDSTVGLPQQQQQQHAEKKQ
jgi:serine/threonine protein kinase